jgi:hypothetical protein
MRTIAEEQIKFVFKTFVTKSVTDDGALRELCGISEDVWSTFRRRDKSRSAKKIGYICLADAIQLMERPTYFKQVLANLSGLQAADPLNIAYRAFEADMDSEAARYDCSYAELEKYSPELVPIFNTARGKWFARQAYIETWAFTRIPGAEKSETTLGSACIENTSFSSTPFLNRMGYMDRIIRRYIPSVTDTVNLETLGTALRAEGIENFPRKMILQEEVWIPVENMESMCDLSTPVEPAWSLRYNI